MPSDAKAVAENLNYKTDDHAFRSVDEYAQAKYRITTDWLNPHIRPGQKLLNIGCGSGEYNTIAANMGLEVLACEPETKAFQLAHASRPTGAKCEVIQGTLFDLKAKTDPADFIVMHDVLEHIEDDQGAVNTLADLLKPTGRAVISVPALQWLFGHHDHQLGHYRRYDKASLRSVLESRFDIVRIRYFGMSLIPITLMLSRWLKRPYPTQQASQGLVHKAFGMVCRLEQQIPAPLGTSLLVEAVRKR